MTKVYIIQNVGWEYNDEYHYRPESSGGVPQVAFRNRETAEERCSELNLDAFTELQQSPYNAISSYVDSYSLEDHKEFLEDLGCIVREWDFDLPKNITKEQKFAIMSELGVVFYEIVPIELE